MLLANVAIPTLFPHWIVAVIVLFPVIVIESLIARRWLSVPFDTAFRICNRANVTSTLVGIPVAYVLSLFVTLPFAVVAGFFREQTLGVQILVSNVFCLGGMMESAPPEMSPVAKLIVMSPATTLVLLIPYYYASVIIERKSLERSLPSVDRALIFSTAIAMNRASYAALFVVFVALVVVAG